MTTQTLADCEIGYSRLETDHPTRHENERTMRACVVRADGAGDREIGAGLVTSPDHWTQFGSTLSDGRIAVLCGFQPQEMAQIEQEQQRLIVSDESRHMDVWAVDAQTGAATNLSGPDRVSAYNDSIREWPADPSKLAITVVNESRGYLYLMNRDGSGKVPLAITEGYAYGLSISPDGKKATWHEDYRLQIADADGQNIRSIDTGQPFTFGPQWSPDGRWLLFLSGRAGAASPIYLLGPGGDLRLASRRTGYNGRATCMDTGDYRGGDTDMPCWASDSGSFYFTARAADGNIELFRYSLSQKRRRRITHSPPGAKLSSPAASPDGRWVAVVGHIDGARNIYVVGLGGRLAPVTRYGPGMGAVHPRWMRSPSGSTAGG